MLERLRTVVMHTTAATMQILKRRMPCVVVKSIDREPSSVRLPVYTSQSAAARTHCTASHTRATSSENTDRK